MGGGRSNLALVAGGELGQVTMIIALPVLIVLAKATVEAYGIPK